MRFIQLKEMLEQGNREKFITLVSHFSCKDKDVERFLKQKALHNEEHNKSRTYLIIDDNDKPDNTASLLAYFTLSLKVLTFDESVSKSAVGKIDGFSRTVDAVATLLIGQFGKDDNTAKDIPGKELLEICMTRIREAQGLVGGRIVMIECLPIPKVIDFYESNGFKFLKNDKTDTYHQMVLPL